jgi:hypothetical protein
MYNPAAVYIIEQVGGFVLALKRSQRFVRNEGRGQEANDRARFAIAERKKKQPSSPSAMV